MTRLLDGATPVLMTTDPPYGVSYDPAWRHRVNPTQRTAVGRVMNDDRAEWTAAWQLFPGAIAYVWHAALKAPTVAADLEAAGFKIRSQIIWQKQHFALSRGDYHWGHEPAWYAVRGKGQWRGDRRQTTVWEVANLNPFGGTGAADNAVTGHGTQKPVRLFEIPILNHTVAGEAVYDPFCGSGTAIIAAEKLGRACYAMEIDPEVRPGRGHAVGSVHRREGRSPARRASRRRRGRDERHPSSSTWPRRAGRSRTARPDSHARTARDGADRPRVVAAADRRGPRDQPGGGVEDPQAGRNPPAARAGRDRRAAEGAADAAPGAPLRRSDAGVGREQSGHDPAASTPDGGPGGAGATVAELVVENQHGDPRYLDEARKALADQRKLWGLDAPQKVDLRASRNPYDDMTEEALRDELAKQTRLLADGEPVAADDTTTNANDHTEPMTII